MKEITGLVDTGDMAKEKVTAITAIGNVSSAVATNDIQPLRLQAARPSGPARHAKPADTVQISSEGRARALENTEDVLSVYPWRVTF